jgi:hypothetical protein
MPWIPCSKKCRNCQRSTPYTRAYFRWVPDEDEEPSPTRRDLNELNDLHGRRCAEDELVAFDSRAGTPKRPNTSGGGYRHGGARVGIAFRQGQKPSDYRQFVKSVHGKDREYFRARDVEYRAVTGSPLRCASPGGTDYEGAPGYSDLFMFHPTYEAATSAVDLNTKGTFLPSGPSFAVLSTSQVSVSISPKIVTNFSGTRKQEGKATESVMGLSAFDAAQNAGVNPTGSWAWLHLLAYSLGGMNGKNPDVPENLVAGTTPCNYYHLAIESAVKKLIVKDKFTPQVSVSFAGHINTVWHVVEFVNYQVSNPSDKKKFVTFKLKCFSTETGYGGDTEAVYQYLKSNLL